MKKFRYNNHISRRLRGESWRRWVTGLCLVTAASACGTTETSAGTGGAQADAQATTDAVTSDGGGATDGGASSQDSSTASDIATAADGSANATCPTSTFLDLTGAAGGGAKYAKPTLDVSCTAEHIVVKSNTMITYKYVSMTPNPLAPVSEVYYIPRNPKVAAETTKIPFLGRVGVAINGIPLFGPNEGPQPDNFGDPVYNGIMDECGGHTAFEYHYHQFIYRCLRQEAVAAAEPWKLAPPAKDKPWGIVAYAMDGFPIYGRYGCLDAACTKVVEFKSSYDEIKDPKELAWESYKYTKKDGEEYLDECNGRFGPDGTYRYHETAGFPYGIACYRGTPNDTGSGGGRGGGGNGGGGNGGGGNGGGGNGGPPTCTDDAGCTGKCPTGSLGCVCAPGPTAEKRCVPTCKTDKDCPKVGNTTLTCGPKGFCRPAGGPPPGG